MSRHPSTDVPIMDRLSLLAFPLAVCSLGQKASKLPNRQLITAALPEVNMIPAITSHVTHLTIIVILRSIKCLMLSLIRCFSFQSVTLKRILWWTRPLFPPQVREVVVGSMSMNTNRRHSRQMIVVRDSIPHYD